MLGWKLPEQTARAAVGALREMREQHPQLDPETLWSTGSGDAFAASMHVPECAASPRRYVSREAGQATLWDGVAVAQAGGFEAHCADELARHWDSLPGALEGQFAVAHVKSKGPAVELITDPLGMLHVYYVRAGGAWLVSNSARLLGRLVGARTWDPVGVSTFITLGWTGADRTLRQAVRVVPGGVRWVWEGEASTPRRLVYYSSSRLAEQSGRESSELLPQLGRSLIDICRHLSDSYGPLKAMLTGGQDSRVIGALLAAGRIPASFTTGIYLKDGRPWDEDMARDVEIAREVACLLDAAHQVNAREAEDLPDWDAAAAHWVRQYDGLRSLCDVFEVLRGARAISTLPVFIGGDGGGIAKGFYTTPELLAAGNDRGAVSRLLLGRCFRRPRSLYRPVTLELLEQFLDDFVAEAVASGLAVADLPDAFYAYERGRRFLGSAQQINRATMDRFQPLCTRPWLEAAFALPASERYAGQLHVQLVRTLAPQLLSVPFDKPQKGIAASAREGGIRTPSLPAATLDRRSALLKTHLRRIRERCLDQAGSPLWDFVSRSGFEQMTELEACEQSGWPYWRTSAIYDIATLFYHAAAEETAASAA